MHSSGVLHASVVRFRRCSLDRRIARGARPDEDPELSIRAAQLRSARCRRGLASSIRRVLDAAEEPPSAFSSSAPLQRRQILAARGLLERLADDLEAEGDASARGVALTRELLTDGRSPFYMHRPEGSIEAAVRQARTALFLA